MFPIDTVAVVGSSEAAGACALLAALAGCAVRVHDASADALAMAALAVRAQVDAAQQADLVAARDRQRILDGVLFTPDLDEAATGADLVVDAAPGTPPATLARLAELLRASAAVAAAGEASPAELVRAIPHPGRVLSLSLSRASGAVARLDVSAGPATTRHVLERAAAFAARVNRAARRGEGP